MPRAMRRSTSLPRKPGNCWPLFPEVIRRSHTANQVHPTSLATTSTFEDIGISRVCEKLAIPVEADFYVCGPSAFLRDMNRDLVSLGVPQSAIHQEVFGSAGQH